MIVFKRCLNCHEDFHQNKFGNNCESCHSTSGWQDYNPERFDHNKTKYPLRGKHLKLECNQCHLPSKPLKIVLFNNCADCHKDYHQGQLSRRKKGGGCEDCHTVEGFSPANFTIAQHSETKYPLQGSHLAVPCSACHKKTNRQTKSETVRFRFKSSNCLTCHKDPHQGEVEKYIKKKGCEYCHSVESWRSVTYDHQETKFPLEGRHLTTRCSHCHKAVDVGTPAEHLQFLKLNKLCQWCHEDEHSGQFRENNIFEKTRKNFTRCQRCHTPVDWLAEKFDHDSDAAFKLKGAHKNVSCELCHKKIIKNEKTITLYKPLAKQCKSCHGNAVNKLN